MNHHYLPEFYSKRWINSLGNLLYYWAPYNKIVPGFTPPSALGCKDNLYAKKDVLLENKHFVETDVYKVIDNYAASAMSTILEGKLDCLTDRKRRAFTNFIHSLLVRHIQQVDRNHEHAARITEKTRQKMTEEQKVHYVKIHEEHTKNLALEVMAAFSDPNHNFGLKSQDDFYTAMSTLTWWIEDFSNSNLSLLTSDYPLQIIPINKSGEILAKNLPDQEIISASQVLLTKNFYLYIPISPTRCFFAAPEKIHFKNNNRLIKDLNLHTVRRAREFVIACDNKQEFFIKRHLKHLIKQKSISNSTKKHEISLFEEKIN